MSTNDTTPTITLRLSCGHSVPFEDDPRDEVNAGNIAEGTPVGCEKCKRRADGSLSVRRVKAVTVIERVVVSDDGGYQVEAPEASVGADIMDAVDEAIAELAPPAPAAEAKRGPRVVAASREARDLKAWTDGGETGPRPATPNLDAIEAESGKKATRQPRAAAADPSNPMALGLAQGPTGMVDSSAMTPDDPTPAKRTRTRTADTASGGRVTDLNLSAPRRTVMLEALPTEPDGPVQDVASVVALRTKVASGADRVDVDAAGVRALLTGLAPMCAAGNKPACRLNEWLTKFADEVGYKPADA